jgi:hypothetical protein
VNTLAEVSSVCSGVAGVLVPAGQAGTSCATFRALQRCGNRASPSGPRGQVAANAALLGLLDLGAHRRGSCLLEAGRDCAASI